MSPNPNCAAGGNVVGYAAAPDGRPGTGTGTGPGSLLYCTRSARGGLGHRSVQAVCLGPRIPRCWAVPSFRSSDAILAREGEREDDESTGGQASLAGERQLF